MKLKNILASALFFLSALTVKAQYNIAIRFNDGHASVFDVDNIDSIYFPGHDEMPEYEYVDLGLSVNWATFNIGASKPEEPGDYFAWGETEPYYEPGYSQENPCTHWRPGKSSGYDWPSHKYCYDSDTTFTKYNIDSRFGYNGFTDGKTILDANDDAATANWGDNWRMPTQAEIDELANPNNALMEWTTMNGIFGIKATSKIQGYTDRSIFLPSNDVYYKQEIWTATSKEDAVVAISSSSLYTKFEEYPIYAYTFAQQYPHVHGYGLYDRFKGIPVRPVCTNHNHIPVSSVTLNVTDTTITTGQAIQLSVNILPYNASNKTVRWISREKSVATVDNTGLVTAIAPGICTIKVSSNDINTESDTCQIRVISE